MDDEPDVPFCERLKLFLTYHWRGIALILIPLLGISVLTPFPPQPFQWCGFTMVVMAGYWVTECLPLPVTAILPLVVFPLTGIMDTQTACLAYFNDTGLMFLGSLIFAIAIEDSGLHKRMALCVIRLIGYSHYKLLFSMSALTMAISMWIANTAATTLMIPIIFALLEVFEEQNTMKIYEKNSDGEMVASKLTSCYFCAATYSATIGGIGTLVGTATNLAFKGLFMSTFPTAPEYLSFPHFSAFAVPYMIAMELCMYLCMVTVYFGFLRPNSATAQRAKISPEAVTAAKYKVESDFKALGRITFYETVVLLLFVGAILFFFCRSPQMFKGWGDLITEYFGKDTKFVKDSVLALFLCYAMFLIPSNLTIFKNCTAKNRTQLPKGRITSILQWKTTYPRVPWGFMFLLGGGFCLSTAAKKEYTDLNGRIGDMLIGTKDLPEGAIVLLLILFTIFVTNFASNVVVANLVCPIAMTLAVKIQRNPLLFCITCGYTASYCYMVPVGTPGNLVVQSVAKIPTSEMIKAGFGPTLTTIVLTWVAMMFWAPVIWPDIKTLPAWVNV